MALRSLLKKKFISRYLKRIHSNIEVGGKLATFLTYALLFYFKKVKMQLRFKKCAENGEDIVNDYMCQKMEISH